MSSSAISLENRTLGELSRMLDAGQVTSESLVRYYIDRIERIDQRDGSTHAILEVNPDALELARQRDNARAAGRSAGPLDGIPVLVKDNIDTADAMLTTAGSWALADSRPAKDAFLVTRLREAGTVLLGKATVARRSVMALG